MKSYPEEIENNIAPKGKKEKQSGMTAKKIKILTSIIYGNLFIGSCSSLMAPIFPREAERKHASPTYYGFVFGVSQLAMFIASPISGKITIKFKPGFVMKAGMLVSGISIMVFGFLDSAPTAESFIALAIFIRIVNAMGASSFLTASYATLANELPDVIGRAMSLTETGYCIGLAGGPVLGGFLYEVGGFRLPFMVMGALLLLGTVVNMVLFSDKGNEIPPKAISAIKLLSDIDILIDVLTISSCYAALGFNDATLEPHIRQFNVSPTVTGLVFLTTGLTDAITSLLWGYCSEKVSNAQYLSFLGVLLSIACFLLVGPISLFNFPSNFWVVVFAQFLLGLGMASEIICCFTHGMKTTVDRGFPNDVGTYGVISGILFSSACLGFFIGPSLGGYLIDLVGYVHATEIVVLMKVVVGAICISRLIYLCIRKKKKDDLGKEMSKM